MPHKYLTLPRDLLGTVAAPFSAFLTYPSLTWELAKRDVEGRYRGSSFGLLWSMLTPFLMLAVFSLAFGGVFGSRWPQAVAEKTSYATILFAGLIAHGFLAECIARGPLLIIGNPSYVKRVIFPLEVLPWSMVLSAFFHAVVNASILAVVLLIDRGEVPPTFVLVPLVLAPLGILGAGLGWVLASLGVYVRDLTQITGVAVTALLFLSTAVLPIEAVPEKYRFVFELNPLTFVVDQTREVALWGNAPDWFGLAWFAAFSLAFAYVAYAFFSATRRGFADVL